MAPVDGTIVAARAFIAVAAALASGPAITIPTGATAAATVVTTAAITAITAPFTAWAAVTAFARFARRARVRQFFAGFLVDDAH